MRITMTRAMSIVRVVINHKKWFKSLSTIHAISQSRSGSSSARESKEYVIKHFKYKALGSRIAIFSDSVSSKLRLCSISMREVSKEKPEVTKVKKQKIKQEKHQKKKKKKKKKKNKTTTRQQKLQIRVS